VTRGVIERRDWKGGQKQIGATPWGKYVFIST
jgi:hypothetical protein